MNTKRLGDAVCFIKAGDYSKVIVPLATFGSFDEVAVRNKLHFNYSGEASFEWGSA